MDPRLLRAFALACVSVSGCASRTASHPPALPAQAPATGQALLHEAIGILSTRPIGADRVDWASVEARLLPAIAPEDPAKSAHAAIRESIAALGDPHASFMSPDEHQAWRDAQIRPPPASDPPPAEPAPARETTPTGRIPTTPEAAELSHAIAYIILPDCGSGDPAALQQYALELRRLILAAQTLKPGGWIIDLRLNGGGNVWPMLLGLQPLIGEGTCAMSIEPGGTARFGCDAKSVWIDWPDGSRQIQLTIEPREGAHAISPAPIAVLIGGWTMSSAEITAAALKGIPGARLFGEPTAGLTTVTSFFELSDGSVLVLPVGAVAGRDGIPIFGPILPDEPVDSSEWPGPDDAVSAAAQAWITSTR